MRCVRIAGNLPPDVPTMLRLPTLPLRLRSNTVRATTPIFLSEPELPPCTKPVVYSPVPTWMSTQQGEDCRDVGKRYLPLGRRVEPLWSSKIGCSLTWDEMR